MILETSGTPADCFFGTIWKIPHVFLETNGEFPLAFLIKSQGNQPHGYNFSQDVDLNGSIPIVMRTGAHHQDFDLGVRNTKVKGYQDRLDLPLTDGLSHGNGKRPVAIQKIISKCFFFSHFPSSLLPRD